MIEYCSICKFSIDVSEYCVHCLVAHHTECCKETMVCNGCKTKLAHCEGNDLSCSCECPEVSDDE